MNTNNITNTSDDLNACSCPDTAKLCKHIFLTSRITRIPFSLCFSLFEPLSDDLPDVEDSCDIDEAENIRLVEYLENIQKYHNSFNNIYQQEMSKIKSGMRMHTLSKMEDAMKRSVANISEVDEGSASLPPRQRQQFFLSYNIIKIKLQKFHLSSIK
ncbi:hypothetical protein G6F47_007159 [Rhizopus delemar]|uniref:SWIM-type domain-containing protein n=1 Tax=Rhizopus delemar (strain RA 99-880 / ATCC MYA-4621 / FGSC 9543 / NRRL 43880) TaxID=246409 RepID=I1CNU7_RHIO9|nr:hypothetical protein RO3G_14838 [Rhizopus delemar RA 99-880]KAG1597613.1 hypothetical protein G6F47_007159 [Rhizopus delemar]|eukprot:EIE90127.1 hypothetical protein RO3G_14838 [Rhizopus delemar RA 99-880]